MVLYQIAPAIVRVVAGDDYQFQVGHLDLLLDPGDFDMTVVVDRG